MDDVITRMYASHSHEVKSRLHQDVIRGCIAPMKAGWLRAQSNYFNLSAEGRIAYERYSDPEEFLYQAGKLSVRGRISIHFPRPYFFLGKVRDQVTSEYRVVRRFGLGNLLKKVGSSPQWQELLPIQTPRRISIPDFDLPNIESLLSYLKTLGLPYDEGGHAIYLPPEILRNSAFRVIADQYPGNSGLKILKHSGGVADSVYVTPTGGDSRLHLKLIHNVRHLTLVANLLYSKNVGPRLHDLVELECHEHIWTAFVMDHVGTSIPTRPECESGIAKIRELEQEGRIKVILPAGFDDEEFECPTCSGNAFINENGKFQYVDFQNFALLNYDAFLKSIATEAIEASHFGDKSILRGGRYLYQSIPAVDLPGKRSVDVRMQVLTRLMETAGVSIEDRLVLDFGCNIGMMMAQYLKLGARWCHGWDRPSVVLHTEKLLLALGCTRFSTTGTEINSSLAPEHDLAPTLQPHLNGCVISYLAVRGHFGWLDELAHIPWKFLIYEGHEGETEESFSRHAKELSKLVSFKVAAISNYTDGDSDARTVAILIRN